MQISLGRGVFLIEEASGTKFSGHKKTWCVLEIGGEKGQCPWSQNMREIVAGDNVKKVAMGPHKQDHLGHVKAFGI